LIKLKYKNKELTEKEFEEKSGYNAKEILWYGRTILDHGVITERPVVVLPRPEGGFCDWITNLVAVYNNVQPANDYYTEEAGYERAKQFKYNYITDKLGTIRFYVETAHASLLESLTVEQRDTVTKAQIALYAEKAALLIAEKYPSRRG